MDCGHWMVLGVHCSKQKTKTATNSAWSSPEFGFNFPPPFPPHMHSHSPKESKRGRSENQKGAQGLWARFNSRGRAAAVLTSSKISEMEPKGGFRKTQIRAELHQCETEHRGKQDATEQVGAIPLNQYLFHVQFETLEKIARARA